MQVPSVLNYPTLVLNRTWTPIQTMTSRCAIGLVVNGAAHIIDPVTFETHDLSSWNAVSRAKRRIARGWIRSMFLTLAAPEVIVLTGCRGMGQSSVVFSRANIFRRDRYACQYCGGQPGTRDLSIDHVVPRSRGGKSTWENSVVACYACNRRKSDLTPAEAGMKLRAVPKKPSWSAIFNVPVAKRCESWSQFVSDAYWEIELEP